MTKKVNEDVVPPSKRKSIRDIPIPANRRNATNRNPVSKSEDFIDVSDTHADTEKPVTKKPAKEKREEMEDVYVPEEHNSVAEEPKEFDADFLDDPVKKKRKFKIKKWPLISGIVGILVIILIFISIGGMEITIHPKQVTATVNSELEARNVNNGNAGLLGFTIIEISEESSQTVKATGEESITTKATGEITIYNEYTEEDQRLVKNTRFESPDGMIYRIPESV
ncbi:hypothetical protein N9L18_01015, partial [Candidatus Pacebacteria bacterium]|nr:hypothetical protein [Candidatus Paceibacterota bacterium]